MLSRKVGGADFDGLKAVKRTSNRSDILKHWMEDYLENSSVAGCVHYVGKKGKRFGDRLFWLTVHAMCVLSLILMISYTTFVFAQTPTVTTPETPNYPIQNINFPGVAICYVNKINYSVAVEIAREILEYDYVGNLTGGRLTDMLKYLGHLYLFELHDAEKETIELLHDLLARRYNRYVAYLMKKLAPDTDCQWMLQHCSWGGKEGICEDLFNFRVTADGYCCTFNYARRSDAFEGKNSFAESWGFVETFSPRTTGSQFGLTVLVRPDFDDHHYKILSTRGYKVLVFPPLDFPDAASGGLREILVAPRTETFLSLDAVPFYSVPAVARFSVAERGCLFNDELSLIFGGYYSYSDCIMYCRIADIRKLCRCIPFFYPRDGESTRFCDLRDLPCLNKHREKWTRVNPNTERKKLPFPHDDELSTGLNCTECLPACTDVLYKVSVSSAPMSAATVHLGKDVYELTDQSIIHVFFKRPGMVRLKQDVLYYWYDLMSNYGGICGLFLGVSIISGVEFLYFFTVRLYVAKKVIDGTRPVKFTVAESAQETTRLPSLYWREFVRSRE